MTLPDITDLIGKPAMAGPLNRPCLWVIEEVYRRMGVDASVFDRSGWTDVPLDAVPVGATLGFEGAAYDFVDHMAVHLGWGLCIHAGDKGIEIVPIDSIPQRVIEANIPCSLL